MGLTNDINTERWRVVGWKNKYPSKTHHLIKPSVYHQSYKVHISFYSDCRKWRKEFSLRTHDLKTAIKRRDAIYQALLGKSFTEEQLRIK